MQRVLVLVATLASVACFRFKEEAPTPTVTDDAAATETATVPDAQGETAPTMCDRYGGFATAEKAATATIAKVSADCRIDRFFLGLSTDQVTHIRECLALQLGSIMRCSRDGVRVKYPNLDSKGVQCKDMRTSHQGKGLAIFAEDFDAFVDDTVDSLAEQKLSAEDLAAVADVLKFERTDVQNPIPDAGRGEACVPEGGTPDTSADDTGQAY
ncbi:MAG: hypothetical protein ACXWP4_24870 [Polyangiales bacterium]